MRTGTPASDFAQYLIWIANQESPDAAEQMTNMYINKLLYMIQGWSLLERGQSAFRESIQAWPRGPVIPEIYQLYKDCGAGPIPADRGGRVDSLDGEEIELAQMVWDRYKGYSATRLSEMAHREAPWRNARRDLPADAPCNRVLDLAQMRLAFQERVQHATGILAKNWDAVQRLAEANTHKMTGGNLIL